MSKTGRFVVRIRGLSQELLDEGVEFVEELLREVSLTEGTGRPHRASGLTGRMTAVVARIYGSGDGREAMLEAFKTGHADVDLDLPDGAEHDIVALALLLDEADEACRDGVLLTLPRSAPVVAMNWWSVTEIARQRHGLAPTPFTG